MDVRSNLLKIGVFLVMALPLHSTAVPPVPTPELKNATGILAGIAPGERVKLMIEVFKMTEEQLLKKGWSLCSGQIESSGKSPTGFRFLSRQRRCFFSAVQYSGLWMIDFIQAPLEVQAYLFMTIDRLRSSLIKAQPISDGTYEELNQKSSQGS